MRTKLLTGLVLAALVVAPTTLVSAASDTSALIVRVKQIDKLDVSDGGTISLDGIAGSNVLGPATDTTAVLKYTHNKTGNMKITAEATSSPAAAGNDLLVSVAVNGGAAKTLYNDVGATGAQDVVAGIAAGALNNKPIAYTAECTASGTKVSGDTNFAFTITYTSVDE